MSDRQLIADLLSALEYHTEQTRPIEFSKVAIEAAREYLRKPVQPMHPEIKKMYEDYFDKCFRESSEPVPENFMDALKFDVAMREWVGLTDEERDEICLGDESIARAIEAKLKEKNT
jgi:hypothetical protein